MLRDNLQPTDFADADCRVTEWMPFDAHGISAYRVWICRCTSFWFQRHEWARDSKNSTDLDKWIFVGSSSGRKFIDGMLPAPKEV